MKDAPIAVITGANGFVGSHLIDLLLEKGWQVRAIVRASSQTRWIEGKKIELHRCGLNNLQALTEVFTGAHYIFHIAGVVKARKKEGYFKGNVDTTRNVLEAAKNIAGLRRILVTSSLAAAGPTTIDQPLTEAMPNRPINAYGFSKNEQEKLVHSYMETLPITIVRPPAVYGPRDGEILLFFKTVKKGLHTEVNGEPKGLSLVHVKDLVHGMFLAVTTPQAEGQTYFLGSKDQYTWTQLAKLAAKLMHKKLFRIFVPNWAVYIVAAGSELGARITGKPTMLNFEKVKEIKASAWCCSSEKAMRELGYYQNPVPFETGIEQTLNWYIKEGWL